jgi:hypothetical protein
MWCAKGALHLPLRPHPKPLAQSPAKQQAAIHQQTLYWYIYQGRGVRV